MISLVFSLLALGMSLLSLRLAHRENKRLGHYQRIVDQAISIIEAE